ncbi:MAG: lysine--tRNA ligase [Cytophagales bacterium]
MNEQETVRRNKIEELRKLGIEPYPAGNYAISHTVKQLREAYQQDADSCQNVTLAGRLMSRRIMGSASFGELQDHTGRMQFYIKRDALLADKRALCYDNLFKRLLDLGDIMSIQGHVFVTRSGTLTLHIKELHLLSKAIKPLPVVKEVKRASVTTRHHNLSNPEVCYRKPYLNFISNPEKREIFQKRAKIMQVMRAYFNEAGYLEVETPVLQPIYGGASARPFVTHHNTLDMQLYLRISNELYLKRLMVGGFPGVYEFAKDFRNEGMSRFHNPEFTQVELYVAYRDYYWMMEQTELLFQKIAHALYGTTKVKVGPHTIDFGGKWQRYTMFEAIAHFTGIDISKMGLATLHDTARSLGIATEPYEGEDKIIDKIFSAKCEPHLIQPTFITNHPISMSPLAKEHRDNPKLAERFELICNGKEICNAFSEQNDPMKQRQGFVEQQAHHAKGDEEAMVLDEDYLVALGHGLGPTVGWGCGIDRLTMIFANQPSIQDVLFFPQMRPVSKS